MSDMTALCLSEKVLLSTNEQKSTLQPTPKVIPNVKCSCIFAKPVELSGVSTFSNMGPFGDHSIQCLEQVLSPTTCQL